MRRMALKSRQPQRQTEEAAVSSEPKVQGTGMVEVKKQYKKSWLIAVRVLGTRLLPESEMGYKGAGWHTATGDGTVGGIPTKT